jgi:hypothetical protein
MRWYLSVICAGIITAHAADELERPGTLDRLAAAGTGWPAPERNDPVWLVLMIGPGLV